MIHYLKKAINFILICSVSAVFVGCGKVESVNDLYNIAKETYGDCTLVSKTETNDETIITVHDVVHDFNYTMSSSKNDILIDGSKFGSNVSSSNTFHKELMVKIHNNCVEKFDDIASTYDVVYDVCDDAIMIYSSDDEQGKIAAEMFAEQFKSYDYNNRLDEFTINVYNGDESIGCIKLSNFTWVSDSDLEIDYYMSMVHRSVDKSAKFIRVEEGKFGDTGLDVSDVMYVLGSDSPDSDDSAVKFYYYEVDGKEYYICDFIYYHEDRTYDWYTNYVK